MVEGALKAVLFNGDLYTGVFTISGDELPPIDPLTASHIIALEDNRGLFESPRYPLLTDGAALKFVLWVEDIVKAYPPHGL
ncbi:MAG: hypothetical protein O6927_04095 [Gammaproteobacteria bacterium]|nr:hypothetical protein [Gammaproteobacteria bacterium]